MGVKGWRALSARQVCTVDARYDRHPMRRLFTILIVVVAACLLFALAYRWHTAGARRTGADALVSRAGQKHLYPDGREVEIIIAGNNADETAVVLILLYSTVDPSRTMSRAGTIWSSNDPIKGLQSTWKLVTHYPPDPSQSGFWVDEVPREIGNGLTAVYISDQQPATDLMIPEHKQQSFVDDAGAMDPLKFIDKWVQPEIPAPHSSQ